MANEEGGRAHNLFVFDQGPPSIAYPGNTFDSTDYERW